MIAFPQTVVAVLVGLFFYMVATVLTLYDGLLSLVFQPVIGGFFSLVVVLGLLVIGLPIRMIPGVNRWWKRYWWVSLLAAGVAFLMMWASWIPSMRIVIVDPDLQIERESFQPLLSIGGWVLAMFAVLHFYPPSGQKL